LIEDEAMIIRQIKSTSHRFGTGFSMIDALVAIVVLATALLALAALQGALTRNSADARARSQLAAYSEGLIDQLRSTGYTSIAATAYTVSPSSGTTAQKATALAAQNAAGVTGLSTTITPALYNGSGSTFSKAGSGVTAATASYRTVNVTTIWTDATGQQRRLSLDTIIDSTTTNQTDQTLINKSFTLSGASGPIVREYNPAATAGVIPIAMGTTGSNTAATNPQPEVLGKNGSTIAGVSFNVLTFTAPDASNESVISQHVDTRVIACSCKYGAGITDTSNVFAQPYQPAYWNGTKYTASPTTATTSTTGADSNATQDAYCDICCRDRNDATGPAMKFDPWTSDFSHYRYVGNTLTAVASSDKNNAYLNDCRLIRVDGQYRVAVDMQNYFFGLLATTTTGTSPIPDPTAVTNYENFVTDYLTGSISSLAAGTGPLTTATAATMYGSSTYGGTNGLDSPANISLNSTTDKRYLHSRGIYIDFLEPDALTVINNAITTCPSGTSQENCVFPLLPFTTINLTELANWTTTMTSISASDTAAPVTDDPLAPLRGVVAELKADGSTPNAQAAIGKSNSGVIGNIAAWAVDPDDQSPLTDSQQFTTSGSGGGGGGGSGGSTLYFNVALAYPSGYDWVSKVQSNSPTVLWNGTAQQLGTAVSTVQSYGYSASTGTPYQWYWYNTCTTTGNGSKQTTSCTPNAVTINSGSPATPVSAPVGLNVLVYKYNNYTTSNGADTATATDGSGKTCSTTNTALQCYSYAVDLNNISITSGATGTKTMVSGATQSPYPSGTTDLTGQLAETMITIPATPGIASTDSTKPDLITVGFGTPTINVASGTCVQQGNGNNYNYKPATSCPQ
jgi:Tfp pilus assembly protein PilV